MATLNYGNRLSNIQTRKFDPYLNESRVSNSYNARQLPENVRYLIESMQPIETAYNNKTLEAARKVQTHLEDGLTLHFNRAYHTQGSVRTGTNIRVYSDFDLLTIIDKYNYNTPEVPVITPYVDSDPHEDIRELRRQATSILKGVYDEVDDSGVKSISIYNKSLKRKVDIVFAYWLHNRTYQHTNDEHHRGIYLYDFPKKEKMEDFPFLHMHYVNQKGDLTYDGSRKGIRLLKNLKADADEEFKLLKGFQFTTIVHCIHNGSIAYGPGREIFIARAISEELSQLIQNPTYRKAVLSPNHTERPLERDEVVPELIRLKNDLDTLIADTASELNRATVQSAIRFY